MNRQEWDWMTFPEGGSLNITEPSVIERVENGVYELDHLYYPSQNFIVFGKNMNEWWEHIDLDKLDMDDSYNDILGQLFRHISPRVLIPQDKHVGMSLTSFYKPKLSDDEYKRELFEGGFVPNPRAIDPYYEAEELKEAWTCEILDRLFPAPQPITYWKNVEITLTEDEKVKRCKTIYGITYDLLYLKDQGAKFK